MTLGITLRFLICLALLTYVVLLTTGCPTFFSRSIVEPSKARIDKRLLGKWEMFIDGEEGADKLELIESTDGQILVMPLNIQGFSESKIEEGGKISLSTEQIGTRHFLGIRLETSKEVSHLITSYTCIKNCMEVQIKILSNHDPVFGNEINEQIQQTSAERKKLRDFLKTPESDGLFTYFATLRKIDEP